jgi:hypothetical protein
MTFADEIDNHKSRCREHLLRLRIVAGSPGDVVPSREVTAEIRDATNAIIAEAEAMSRAAIWAVEREAYGEDPAPGRHRLAQARQ